MKNNARLLIITLIVLFAIVCMPAKSQTYIPIPLDSTIWKVRYWVSHPWPYTGCECYMTEYTDGDTIINSKTYTIIKRFNAPNCNQCAGAWIERAIVRQDSAERKVYIILPDSTNEHVLYDFSQTAGDTCNSILYPDPFACGQLIISSVDSVLINSKYHRRLNLQGGCLISGNASLIEGVGSTLGFLEKLLIFESGTNLICAHQYKTTNISIYPNGGFVCDTSSVGITENQTENYRLEVFPNPFEDIINFEYVFPIKNIRIYNLLGQEIYYLVIGGKQKVQLSRKEFARGLFIYRVETNDERVFKGKFVAE